MLMARGKLASPLSPFAFFSRLALEGACEVSVLDAEALAAASFLPGRPHRDPADRMFMAVARLKNLALVTRDKAILAYGAEGHLHTLAC